MPLNRRDFLALVSSGVAAGSAVEAFGLSATSKAATEKAAAAAAPVHQPHPRRRQPNVVLMICDDIGCGDMGCYGSKLPTPNLDAMAAEGMRFTHFNASHPICSASRAGLLTGRYGVRCATTGAFGPKGLFGTSTDETLLSNLFHAQGYKTKAIGKWHLGDAPQYLPTNRGFDSFYGVPYSVDMHPLPLIRDTTILEEDTDRKMLTPLYTTEAVSYINSRKKDEPFFLYLGFSYPHDPAKPSPRFKGKTKFWDYGDTVAEIDWSVGEIMRAIDKKGLGDDTLILFTSDHGPWYQGNPGWVRGRKASTFEGGFRVPFLARWSGVVPAGKVEETWCGNLDVLPTMSALCGLGVPAKPLDGTEFSSVLTGEGKLVEHKPVIYFSPMGERGIDVHCIRRGPWKLRVAQGIGGEIYLNDRTTQSRKSAWLAEPELYNLELDPAESYDVATSNPRIVATLLEDLENLMPSFPEDVRQAYADLKKRKGNSSTPKGASPRPA
jgi:arylsulfatase